MKKSVAQWERELRAARESRKRLVRLVRVYLLAMVMAEYATDFDIRAATRFISKQADQDGKISR